jgi:hypothetical protein
LALGAQVDESIDLTEALSAAAFKDIVKERLSE